VQLLGCAAKVQFVRYGEKVTQLSQFHSLIIADPLIMRG
jgi:hypothetical protein